MGTGVEKYIALEIGTDLPMPKCTAMWAGKAKVEQVIKPMISKFIFQGTTASQGEMISFYTNRLLYKILILDTNNRTLLNKIMERLRLYNAVMAFLHLSQGVLLIVLSNNFSLPVTTNYLSFNVISQTLEQASRTLFDLRFGPAVAVFSLLSAFFHLIIATVYYPSYKANLEKGINKARWWEYSLSASLMIVLIAMLSGVYDLSSLVMMFALTAIMNLCGLFMEIYNQGKTKVDWGTYLLGCFAGIIPWIVILIYFWGAASESNNAIPNFVYWIYVSIFIFFNSFAVNMYLQYQKIGPWRNYKFGELMYIILSLVAKSALAWQIFAGTLRPQ